MRPEVIFADEPTGNLDSHNSQKVMHLLLECAKRYQQTVIYVTHDTHLAALADRQIQIKDGRSVGKRHLKNKYSIVFFMSANILSGYF